MAEGSELCLSCCYKETRINPRVMPPETGLEMGPSTRQGGADDGERIGSIEVGKEPISCYSIPIARVAAADQPDVETSVFGATGEFGAATCLDGGAGRGGGH